MNKRQFAITIQCFLVGLASLTGCVKATTPGGDGGTADPSESALYVKLATQYDGANTKVVNRTTCSVPKDSQVGTTITCAASVPQEQLFYSGLQITQSTNSASTCDQIEFVPYVYQESRSANFKPEWAASAVDCSANPTPAGCFNGPATTVISDFPLHRSVFVSTGSAITASYTVPSAFAQGRHSNRWASNDMPAALRAKDLKGGLSKVPISDDYLANTMQDYVFNCKNTYGATIYSIVMTIAPTISASPLATDVSDPAINRHPSWVGAMAPQPLSGTTPGSFPFQVVVQTQYDNDDPNASVLTHQTCSVPSGTAPGAAGSQINCSASIPEAQLYFGKLILTETADSSASCEVLTFTPYYYQASISGTFSPEWTQIATDCSGAVSPLPNDCFNGIGPLVVPGWPIYRSIYQTTNTALSLTFNASSANRLKRSSNRMTCNSLAAGKRNSNLGSIRGDGYVAGSMVDYVFSCRDKYFQALYQVNLTIDDVDVGTIGGPADVDNPAKNNFPNWSSTVLDPH